MIIYSLFTQVMPGQRHCFCVFVLVMVDQGLMSHIELSRTAKTIAYSRTDPLRAYMTVFSSRWRAQWRRNHNKNVWNKYLLMELCDISLLLESMTKGIGMQQFKNISTKEVRAPPLDWIILQWKVDQTSNSRYISCTNAAAQLKVLFYFNSVTFLA